LAPSASSSVEMESSLHPDQQNQSHVTELRSPEEFLSFVDGHEKDALCVVKFYANYCRVCKRTKQTFRRMAHLRSNDTSLKFAVVEIAAMGGPAVKSLGVNLTPFVQIYRNGLCVASFSTGPAHNFRVKAGSTLDLCTERTPADWETFERDFETQIQLNRKAVDALYESIVAEDEEETSKAAIPANSPGKRVVAP